MALKDVKEYYYRVAAQYLEMKDTLAEYDEAAKEGKVTEEQLADVKEDIARIEQNYYRLSYILYLFELPKNSKAKTKFNKMQINKDLESYFNDVKGSSQVVLDENASMITHIRAKLKEFLDKFYKS